MSGGYWLAAFLAYTIVGLATDIWAEAYNPPGRGMTVERITLIMLSILWPVFWLMLIAWAFLRWIRPVPNRNNNKEAAHG